MTTEGLRVILDRVESHEVAAQVGLASSLHDAVAAVRRIPEARELSIACEEFGGIEAVLRRLERLARTEVDLRYEHPYDVAMLIYLDVLNEKKPALAVAAAGTVLRARSVWWAGHMSARLVSDRLSRDGASRSGTTETGPRHSNRLSGDLVVITVGVPLRDFYLVAETQAHFGSGASQSDSKGFPGELRASSSFEAEVLAL